MAMNSEVKKIWIKALLSKKYKQGKGCLKRGDEYCCLGVLTDLYLKKFHPEIVWNQITDLYPVFKNHNDVDFDKFLPEEVMKWAGFTLNDPIVCYSPEDPASGVFEAEGSLAVYNDEGSSFEEIAAIIQEAF